MKNLIVGLLCATITFMPCEPAFAWAHANAYGGGSTAHAEDTRTRTYGYGGEATHTAGQGASYQNKEGESAYRAGGQAQRPGGSAIHSAGQELFGGQNLPQPIVRVATF